MQEGQRLLGLLSARERLLLGKQRLDQPSWKRYSLPFTVCDISPSTVDVRLIFLSDLSLDARIKYVSDSIEDILGYRPNEVKGKSCWDYFHPDEIPFAREVHGRGINLDKAAVLNYCRIQHKDGSWVGCECVFTVVYDVLVSCTSIYKRNPRAQRWYPLPRVAETPADASLERAIDGAGIRRIFSSSPRDPRYHMLSFLSSKFYTDPKIQTNEPRAALFLNRFTRTSTIMFATNGVSNILGLRPEQMVGKSFYYCIQRNCLQDAVRCLEKAKANDSIAYLRFWYQDPLQAEAHPEDLPVLDDRASEDEEEEDDDDGGGVLIRREDTSASNAAVQAVTPETTSGANTGDSATPRPTAAPESPQLARHENVVESVQGSRDSSGTSTELGGNAREAIFDPPATLGRSGSSVTPAEDASDNGIELEAVVSCSSDGLVVVLRRARPFVPYVLGTTEAPPSAHGLFASPWALEPVMPPHVPGTIPPEAAAQAVAEPEPSSFMSAIREIAVFAWSLTGINGSLAQIGRGKPSGESIPPGGFPIWDRHAPPDPEAERFNGFAPNTHRPLKGVPDPYDPKKVDESTSSEDEILWMRSTTMPAWRRPARRGHQDAFGEDGDAAREEEERAAQSRRRKIEKDS